MEAYKNAERQHLNDELYVREPYFTLNYCTSKKVLLATCAGG